VKVSVLAFDLSDNATGRADLLARLLAPRYEVEVVGPRFGDDIWRPARGGGIRYRALPGARWPRFASVLPALARLADGDVLLASKPRPTSFGVALLARRQRRRPLLLDVDDWELGFFYRSGFWGRVGRLLNVSNPNGLPWTWLVERRLVSRADALTVASRFLAERFGGALLPHVRDTDAWAPQRFDRAAARARLGVGDARVVMFLGTPRAHKGIDDLVEATAGLDGARLVLVGAAAESEAARRWAGREHVRVVGEIAFDDVPRYLIAADVVAVPQRATTDTIGQVPAKLFDAMALGRPIVSTAVSMIPEILEGCGVLVPPQNPIALRAALGRLLDDPAGAAELGRRARERCAERYSFTAARSILFPLIDDLTARFGLPRGT